MSNLNPWFFSESPLSWQLSCGLAGLGTYKSGATELKGKDTSQNQILIQCCRVTRFQFLRVVCFADLGLYWGWQRTAGSHSFTYCSHLLSSLWVWIELNAWVYASWSLTYWQDSCMERVPAFKKVLKCELCSRLSPKECLVFQPWPGCHLVGSTPQRCFCCSSWAARLLSEGTWPLQDGSGALKGACVCPKVGIGQAKALDWKQLFKQLQLFPLCLLPLLLSIQIRVSEACMERII